MTKPQPSLKRFNLAAETWDQNPGRVKMARAIAKVMLKKLSVRRSWTLLDFGSGTGLIALEFVNKVMRILAFDPAYAMRNSLKKKLIAAEIDKITVLGRLPAQEKVHGRNQINVIVSAMVFHHLRDYQKVLERFRDILKSKGYIAIADLDQEDGTFHADKSGVEHFGIKRSELKRAAQAAGFEDIGFTTAYTLVRGERKYPIFLMIAKKA